MDRNDTSRRSPPLLQETVVEQLLRWTVRARDAVGSDNVCVHLLSSDRKRLICQAISDGFRATHLAYGLDVSAAQGAHQAILEGKPVTVDDTLGDQRVAQVARERYGLRACLYVPLMRDGRGVGIAIFSYQRPHGWTQQQQEMAVTLSEACAQLLPSRFNKAAEFDTDLELRLRIMLDTTPGLVLAIDRDHLILDSNSTLLELADRDQRTWLSDLLHRSSRAQDLRQAMHDLFEGQRPSFAALTELDGSFWRIDMRAIASGDDSPIEVVTFSCSDVESNLQARQILENVQQTEALGRISASVAHEYNNLMQILGASLETIADASAAPASREQAQTAASDALDRGSKLARQLLTFAQAQPNEPTRFDLRQQLMAWWPLLESTAGHERPLDLQLEPCPPVVADPEQLRLALINLLLNARDASRPGQTIQVRLYSRDHTTADGRKRGKDTVLAVCDSGTGMTGEVLRRAAEPFVTTKPRGLGVGLGLAVTKSIVEAVGGSLHIDSTIGKGTTIELHLPAAEASKIEAPRALDASEATRGRVLVVEDEDLTLEWLRRVLTRDGYETRLAATGAEMREVLQQEPDWPQLVVLDMMLPDADGGQLYRELQDTRPGLPVVVSTGYAEGRDIVTIRQDGHPVLSKPYSARDLLSTISSLPGMARDAT